MSVPPYFFPLSETSKKITYIRYDKNAYAHYGIGTTKETKLAGMCSIVGFSYSLKRLHEVVCLMLENLRKHEYLKEYRTIYFTEKDLKKAVKNGWISEAEEKTPYGIDFKI